MEYLYTARFLRSYKKLPEGVQADVARAASLFERGARADVAFNKLHGKFRSYHAFSVNFEYRIIVKVTKKAVYHLDVGTHDLYR